MYISGVSEEESKKLLGIPECESGRGIAEFNVVKDCLDSLGVKKEILGMVFDTTASNSGAQTGACTYLEIWLGNPILWLACRRHVAELHIGTAVKHVMGATKDPGVDLFQPAER